MVDRASLARAPLQERIAALIADGFYRRAASALAERLAKNPQNAALGERLVEMYRAAGDLDGARRACEQCRTLRPDDPQIASLLAILSGHALPGVAPEQAPTTSLATPFVCLRSFLPAAEHSHLIAFACEQQATVVRTRIGGSEHRPEARSSAIARKAHVKALEPWFVPRIRMVLPGLLCRLLPQPMRPGEIELQLTAHGNGDFYRLHRDVCPEAPLRRLSYAYYFHHSPKGFTGGDLLLYDSNVASDHFDTAFTRIEPVDNMIVFFPSDCFHQVTSVRCDTDDFRHSRFTLNGWIHGDGTNES